MKIGIRNTILTASTTVIQAGTPPESVPLDAYQEPVAVGDDYYYRTRSAGYLQEPAP